jgi:hypothetical protein
MRSGPYLALSLGLAIHGCGKGGAPEPDPAAQTPNPGTPAPQARGDVAHPVVVVALAEGSVPDVEVDAEDRIHVAWLTNSGNVVYGHYRKDGEIDKHPVRVNDVFGTATGGNFRGPDLALGEDGRAHVVWYPSQDADQEREPVPGIHYAHADPDSTFGEARSLNRRPSDNFSVAADGSGNVEVLWTADQLFLQRSEDGGDTWSDPRNASMQVLPCECCGTRLYLDGEGGWTALYRDRADDIRDIHVIVGAAGHEPTRHRLATESWEVNVCPMSGSYMVPAGDGLAAAWRTKDAIEFVALDPAGEPRWPVRRVEDEGAGKRYPVIVAADDGTLLVAYKRGVTLYWRLYEPDGTPRGEHGSSETENPSRAAGGAVGDGTFVIFG